MDLTDATGKITTDPNTAALLTLSVSQELWGLQKPKEQTGPVEIIGLEKILNSLLRFIQTEADANIADEAIKQLYDDGKYPIPFATSSAIGSIQYSLDVGPLKLKLSETKNFFDSTHWSLFAATDKDDVIDGSSQNNIIAGSDGNDTLIGHLGRDILIGGAGNDLFIDSVTEKDGSRGQQNEFDIYSGSISVGSLIQQFRDWWRNPFMTETDTVRYTVDSFRKDDPSTPVNEAALQAQGVKVTDLHQSTMGTMETIVLTVMDQASGKKGTDTLIGIEKIELSDRPDEFKITDATLDSPILVDMGKSGRIKSELPPGETLAKDAFTQKLDVADYSSVTHGLIYVNGATQSHIQYTSVLDIISLVGLAQEIAAINDIGNDNLRINGADKIILTDKDDVFISGSLGTLVTTGNGYDKVWLTNGVAITDLSKDDRISLGGVLTLYGGLRNGASENPLAFGPYGTAYGINRQGDLIISNALWRVVQTNPDGSTTSTASTMYVLNWHDNIVSRSNGMGYIGAGNIFLAEYTMAFSRLLDLTGKEKGKVSFVAEGAFDILGLAIKTLVGTAWFGGEDPLVLDLDGDGIELTPLDRIKPKMDIDNDLYAEATGFVGKDDGVLVRDINKDGQISGSSEMFGSSNVSGFSQLALLDANKDGKVNAADNGLADFDGNGVINAADTFNSLQIWKDANENQTVDFDELKSVADWKIASITLPTSALPPAQRVNGNTITQTSSYTLTDGTTKTIGDVTFKLENQVTNYVGPAITIKSSVATLPDLKGYGTLVSLREAMSNVENSETAVKAALPSLSSPDLAVLRTAIRPILDAWAKGSPVKVDGVVLTGSASVTTFDDLPIVKYKDNIVDYAWGLGSASGAIATLPKVGTINIQFATGAMISTDIAGFGSGRGSVSQVLDSMTSASALAGTGANKVTYTTGTAVDGSGVSHDYIQYQKANGQTLRIYDPGSSGWSSALKTGATHAFSSECSFNTIAKSDFAFYERFIGESLKPFFINPTDPNAGFNGITEFLSKMNSSLDVLAVRLAIQGGPLAGYFSSISYNAAEDTFSNKSGTQISSVFLALLNDAEKTADAAAWLKNWKPFFDVFIADYQREFATVTKSYAYLVQNMMKAVETNPGGLTVEAFAKAFGIPDGLIINGSGNVTGTGDIDIFLIDGNETKIEGGSGLDNYIVGKNFHTAEIYEIDAFLATSPDMLRFASHKTQDLVFSRNGIDLLITDKVTLQTLTITNQFEGRWPGAGISDASYDYGVAEIIFSDGTVWGQVEIAESVVRVDDASTTVTGTADIDVLQGGKGNDRLEGAGDSDVYRYSKGDGWDTILDLENNAFRDDIDMLQFLGGIRLKDLSFLRIGDSNDVTITVLGSAIDKITVSGQFSASYTGVFGTWYANRIEMITFDDGSSVTADQIAQYVQNNNSTTGNDNLYGMDREDTLRAGKGDDYVSGGNQSDTYLFGRGDGRDIIQDKLTNILSGTDDTLRFDADIRPEDIVVSRNISDLNTVTLTIRGTGDSVTLKNQYSFVDSGVFGLLFFDRIENIKFTYGSGTTWTSQDLALRIL